MIELASCFSSQVSSWPLFLDILYSPLRSVEAVQVGLRLGVGNVFVGANEADMDGAVFGMPMKIDSWRKVSSTFGDFNMSLHGYLAGRFNRGRDREYPRIGVLFHCRFRLSHS